MRAHAAHVRVRTERCARMLLRVRNKVETHVSCGMHLCRLAQEAAVRRDAMQHDVDRCDVGLAVALIGIGFGYIW